MYLHAENNFLTKGSTQIPKGPWVAMGIHSSSEVDLVDCHGFRLGVKSLMPINGSSGVEVKAVRFPLTPWETIAPATAAQWMNPLDGNTRPGERLVLVCYDKCDALVPSGPRHPAENSYFGKLNANQVATTAAAAALLFRIPMSGRAQATIFLLTDLADTQVVFRGVKYGVRSVAIGGGTSVGISNFVEPPVDDVWAGAAAQPVSQVYGGNIELSRGFNIGGRGDNCDPLDEIQVFAYSATGANVVVANYTAFGERLQ